MARRRIVITGMGAVTPLGCSVEKYWDALLSGRSGIAPITHFDATEFDTHFAGQCNDFDPGQWIEGKAVKRMDPFAQFALASAIQAVNESGLDFAKEDPFR